MIKLIRLGRIAANLPPRVLKPSQTPLATDLRPFPTAKTTAFKMIIFTCSLMDTLELMSETL